MPVPIEHRPETSPIMPPADDNVGKVRLSERLPPPPNREQTATTSLHQSSYVDSHVEGFDQELPRARGGGRNSETEATTTAWHDRLQKQRLIRCKHIKKKKVRRG